MNPVIQQDITGCAIASAAAIAGITYRESKVIASNLGISVHDPQLWSSPEPLRRLLRQLGINTASRQTPFKRWRDLPDCSLLAIKWHLEKSTPNWHWVIFVREGEREYVLDSKKGLKNNVRTDFLRIKPKWYIGVSRK